MNDVGGESTTTSTIKSDKKKEKERAQVCSVCFAVQNTYSLTIDLCENACLLCKGCALSEDVRNVLFEVDQVRDEMKCMVCEEGQLLSGRNTKEEFIENCNLAFPIKPIEEEKEEKKDDAFSSILFRGKNSPKASKRNEDEEARLVKQKWKRFRDLEAEKKAAKSVPILTQEEIDDKRYILGWSGGMVDVRVTDLHILFDSNPVGNFEKKAYPQLMESSPLKRFVEIASTDRSRRKEIIYRKTNLRNLLAEIDELFVQWMMHETNDVLLADSFIKFTYKQYGMKKFAEQHLCSISDSVLSFQNSSKRVAIFGKVLGILNSKTYSSLLSRVLREILDRLFEGSAKNLKECLDFGEGKSYIKSEKALEVINGMFEANHKEWILECMFHACEQKGLSLPWNQGVKSSFLGNIKRLSQKVGKKAPNPTLRGATDIMELDSFVLFSISSWMVEWARTCAQLDAVEQREKDLVQKEIERRKEIIKIAENRPFTVDETKCLRNLVERVKKEQNMVSIPKEHKNESFWHLVHLKNEERRCKQLMPYLINRNPEALCESWFKLEEERIKKEKIFWNFYLWEWEEDWEWGGLQCILDERANSQKSCEIDDDQNCNTIDQNCNNIDQNCNNNGQNCNNIDDDQNGNNIDDDQNFNSTEDDENSNNIDDDQKSITSEDGHQESSTSEDQEEDHNGKDQEKDNNSDDDREGNNDANQETLEEKGNFEGNNDQEIQNMKPESNTEQTFREEIALDAPLGLEKTKKKAPILKKNTLNLRHYHGGNQGADTLAEIFSTKTQTFESLELGDNSWTDRNCAKIVDQLDIENKIFKFDVSRNKASKLFIESFINRLPNCFSNIHYLNLGGNKFKNEHIIKLLKEFGNHHHLETLSLRDNFLGRNEKIGKALGNLLKSDYPPLRELDLSWNQFETKDILPLLTSCKSKVKLQQLNLSFNRLDDEISTPLRKFIGNEKKLFNYLEQLNISYNHISKINLSKIMKVKEKSTVHRIIAEPQA